MTPLKVGVIGCGNISPAYFTYLQNSSKVSLVACADMLPEKAQERAKQFGVESVYTVEEMLESNVDAILNLTIPSSHAAVSLAALEHGKHVYTEKPLAISLSDGKKMLELAARKGLVIGSAPDTFMGSGLETARQALLEGVIGRPVAATAFMMGAGPEGWHPNPAFFYAVGGGPMFDMGPYYLTALVQLLGPIARISGSAGSQIPERKVGSGPDAGKPIPVQTPTHYSGTLDFASGVIGTMVTSFDIRGGSTLPWIEIYGTEGTLRLPDPNYFEGEVKLRKAGSEEWTVLPPVFESHGNERGRGLEEMAEAIAQGREPKASGLVAYHVLEAMHAFGRSSQEGRHIALESAAELSAALAPGQSGQLGQS
ncbi:Gfo/Idh/MocA family protein [Paenibacillus physcomitrellae]|uniref:Dehydrogenase n=1 Tax=Paenibacillus physcomitrellae TaxID=1619311 RepID=A0ABQ1FMU7_9BACL|nr:Gfo/Idh/MocA family oxidoreductase [Paenibacillus physcomitrellae]GGA22061.1 dehydrogenase [Paenibacillus physcomitrellae]